MKINIGFRFLKGMALLFILAILISFGKPINAKISNIQSSDTADSLIYLPLSMKNYPWRTIFGTQTQNLGDETFSSLAVDAGLDWVRLDAFNWSKIEPQRTDPPTYKWNSVDQESLKAAKDNGIEAIAIVRGTPDWAQKYPGISCGPINNSELDEFASFLNTLVKRYSVPPYSIKYWELGNEPDVDPALVSPSSVFGCWGDDGDRHYGGRYYADMLKVAYPAIKSADPEAKVLIGGLLLDCDPSKENSCKSGKFLDGILENDGGQFFDILSFHGYPHFGASSKWDHRGGVVLGKVDYIRQKLANKNLEKPIFHTEGSLLCHPADIANCEPPGTDFYEAQADYLPTLFVTNWVEGIEATIWYQFEGPGWRFGGLLDEDQNPKPVYDTLQFMTQQLGSATYIGRVFESTPVAGYKFKTFAKEIWVLWSPDGSLQSVTLPSSYDHIFDKYGDEISLTNNQLEVGSPVYVEFNK